MREIEIRHSEKTHIDPGNGTLVPMERHTAIDLVLPEIDGIFPTHAGDLSVTRIEEPPGIELKGDVVGGTVFVAISHNPTEKDPFKRYGGSTPLGDRGAITVYAREFREQLGSGYLLPTHPKQIFYPQRNTL